MRISKTALWLSVIDALLVLLASASGIFLKSIYAREPPFLVFSILTATAILVIFLVMSSKGMPTSFGVEAFIAVIILVSLVLSVLYVREVKEQREGGLLNERR